MSSLGARATAVDFVNLGVGTSTPTDNDNVLPIEVANKLFGAEANIIDLPTAQPRSSGRMFESTATTGQKDEKMAFFPPPAPPRAIVTRPSFVAVQEWEGAVTSVSDDIFSARLINVTSRGARDEEAEFSLSSDVNEDDLSLVAVGAIFRWAIGLSVTPGGSKSTISQVVFRRLPQWTERSIRNADASAQLILRSLKVDGEF